MKGGGASCGLNYAQASIKSAGLSIVWWRRRPQARPRDAPLHRRLSLRDTLE